MTKKPGLMQRMPLDHALGRSRVVVVHDDHVPAPSLKGLLLEGVQQPAQAQMPRVRCHHHADGDRLTHGSANSIFSVWVRPPIPQPKGASAWAVESTAHAIVPQVPTSGSTSCCSRS